MLSQNLRGRNNTFVSCNQVSEEEIENFCGMSATVLYHIHTHTSLSYAEEMAVDMVHKTIYCPSLLSDKDWNGSSKNKRAELIIDLKNRTLNYINATNYPINWAGMRASYYPQFTWNLDRFLRR